MINKTRVRKSSTFKTQFFFNTMTFTILFFVINILLSACESKANGQPTSNEEWVGTWVTAPQLVEERNNPPEPGLTNNTIRQIFRISLGGKKFRMKFTNEFSSSPVTMKSVHIALSTGNGSIDLDSDKALLFDGQTEITIAPGTVVVSDPFEFSAAPRTDLAVTIYFGETSEDVSGHPGSRTTSYILTGDQTKQASFADAVTTDHWYVINSLDVLAPEKAAAVAIIGNSITDGRGSGTNKQNRWPDILSERLLANPETEHIAVLNLGIGGNCVLRDCLGPSALSRFERDVLNSTKVKWLIIYEGINDIGGTKVADWAEQKVSDLISAYETMIDTAHAYGIKVFGATMLPFGESFYDTEVTEAVRSSVNQWILSSNKFDAVIDLEAALQNPEKPSMLLPEADDGDHLHPSEIGHKMIGEAVDLNLFK